jgi:hypothetical protein
MKINDVIAMFLAIIGTIIAFYEYELFFGQLDWTEGSGDWTYEVEET